MSLLLRVLHSGRVRIVDVTEPECRKKEEADIEEHRQEEHAREHHEQDALEDFAVVNLAKSNPDERQNGSDAGV